MTPCWKQAFETPQQASQQAKKGFAHGIRPYQCTHCKKWHFTSHELQPKRKRSAMDRRRAR